MSLFSRRARAAGQCLSALVTCGRRGLLRADVLFHGGQDTAPHAHSLLFACPVALSQMVFTDSQVLLNSESSLSFCIFFRLNSLLSLPRRRKTPDSLWDPQGALGTAPCGICCFTAVPCVCHIWCLPTVLQGRSNYPILPVGVLRLREADSRSHTPPR